MPNPQIYGKAYAILSSERHTAERVRHFTESIIRDMTRINNNLGGVNMAQGFPDFLTTLGSYKSG